MKKGQILFTITGKGVQCRWNLQKITPAEMAVLILHIEYQVQKWKQAYYAAGLQTQVDVQGTGEHEKKEEI